MAAVWLDTDIGGDVDDAVALLCSVRHPDIKLVGVSTVFGRVDIRAWLSRELLNRAGLAVPVLPGAATPVSGQTPPWEPTSYEHLAPADLQPISPEDDDQRIDAIGGAMAGAAEPFHLVTIGAMTNAARLIDRHPGLAERWLSVTCMAGRLEADPEYNVRCDPAAAKLVAERLGPRMVGLEASSNTLTRQETEDLLDPADPSSAFLLDCYREYRNRAGHRNPETAPLTLYDPISLLSVVRPEAFDFQQVKLLVEKTGRLRLTDDGVPVEYALSSDWHLLRPLIASLLRGTDL